MALRREMEKRGIDAYLVPTTDFHGSEYVNDYFKCRKYVSGFTGSAGTLLVTGDFAGLWTDGRYFLQAEKQLQGSGISLIRINQPGVLSIREYLTENLEPESTIAFDGRVVDADFGMSLETDYNIKFDLDLVGEIWKERPALHGNEIYELPLEAVGETAESKLKRLRLAMEEKGADYHIITGLEEIAWLYNLRGSDVSHTPVFFAFALISKDEDRLYTLHSAGRSIGDRDTLPYFQFFEDIKELKQGRLLLDTKKASYTLVKSLPENVEIISDVDPVEAMKAVKNQTELRCTENAHIKDGLAMVQFIFWLKNNVGKIDISEISAADKLEALRRRQPGCFDLSFDTIPGYMENGAIVHYAPTADTNKRLRPEGLFLVDSGGQYEDGTTDITRTIALGSLTDEMRENYTTVLKSNLELSMAEFEQGTTGAQLDEIARKPLKARGLDFNHGTGHGVGHILSVHEGPNRISPTGGDWPILPGMITTDEPGVYKEGAYGIRLENELVCVEKEKDGALGFEPITLCPFDRDAILPEMLSKEEREYLNAYHEKVYRMLRDRLEPDARSWLREQTEEL